MPNGGPRPDCVHCKHYRGRPIDEEGDPYCAYHRINLPFPIYAFCSHFADNEPDVEVDWLDEVLDRNQLRDDMMYAWLGGYEIKFTHVPLVPISEYANWSREKFLSERTRLSDEAYKSSSSPDGKPDP